jgi:hypothetical protein
MENEKLIVVKTRLSHLLLDKVQGRARAAGMSQQDFIGMLIKRACDLDVARHERKPCKPGTGLTPQGF